MGVNKLFDINLVDPRPGRTTPGPMNHRRDRFGVAHDECFNAAIAAIAYPSLDVQSMRRVDHVIAKADPLHKTGNNESARFHWRSLI